MGRLNFMNEMEDKDFSWSPEFGWRMCIRLLSFRWLIAFAVTLVMMLCLYKLKPDLGGSPNEFTRFHMMVVGVFALVNSFVLLRGLMNSTGLGEWSLFLAAFLTITLLWAVVMVGLFLFELDEYYMMGITFCCLGMLGGAWGMLKFQDYQ